jgi:MinD superfamily P-loop ATPase
MAELVVISGKGGTGKTSITASLATLASSAVLVDCDVDASNLHLVLEPEILERFIFLGSSKSFINPEACAACGQCKALCKFDAVLSTRASKSSARLSYRIDPILCEGCGVCLHFCPHKAITAQISQSGQWFVSQTRHGPLIHARLNPAVGNSGKLVHLLRQKAKELATAGRLIICDGSPGLGCPVIASLTGTDLALVVAEPTLSSLHDLGRLLDLTRHFGIETVMVINKWDMNESVANQIESVAEKRRVPVVGRIRYDSNVTDAQIHRQSVVEYDPTLGVSKDLRHVWKALELRLDRSANPMSHPYK